MSRYFRLILTPSPCHTSRDPPKYVTHLGPPQFLAFLVQKPGQKPPVQILSQLLNRGGFYPGVFSLEGFVRGGFCLLPLLSECIWYKRKLNITLNFLFHMYDKFFISVTSHSLDPHPTPSRTPSPLERDVLYGRPLSLILNF